MFGIQTFPIMDNFGIALYYWPSLYLGAIIGSYFTAFSVPRSEGKLSDVWRFTSRVISIFHALIVVSLSIYIIYKYPEVVYYDELIDIQYPSLLSEIRLINVIMFGYLLCDCLALILIGSDGSMIQTLAHHIVGGASMIGFYYTEAVYWNSLYYFITELSTIFLHLTWFALKLESSKILISVLGLLTWLSFFIIRIIGGIWLMTNVFLHMDDVKPVFSTLQCGFFVYANFFVVCLNFFWFWKLTLSLLKHLQGGKVKAD